MRQRNYSPEFWAAVVNKVESEQVEIAEEHTPFFPFGFVVSSIFGLIMLSRLVAKISEVILWLKG